MTERYIISKDFNQAERSVIEQFLKESGLPEGITVYSEFRWNQNTQKPFLVASWHPDIDDIHEAFRAGTIDYVQMNYDPQEILRQLDDIYLNS